MISVDPVDTNQTNTLCKFRGYVTAICDGGISRSYLLEFMFAILNYKSLYGNYRAGILSALLLYDFFYKITKS